MSAFSMPHNSLEHKAYGALSSTRILLATKIQDNLAKAPTSRDAICFSMDPTPVHELTKWARRLFIWDAQGQS